MPVETRKNRKQSAVGEPYRKALEEKEKRSQRRSNVLEITKQFNAKPLKPSTDMPTEAQGGPLIRHATFVYPKPQSTGLSQEFGRMGGKRRRTNRRKRRRAAA